MDFQTPFRPDGRGRALFGSFAVSPPGTMVNRSGDWQALVYNRSATQDAYLAWGPTSDAVNTSIIPIAGEPGSLLTQVVPVPFRQMRAFTFSGPTFFGVITPAGNAVIDLIPGNGS